MKLTEHTLADFAAVLASDAPAPGGGSTAALMGALGMALAEMVAALTAKQAKFAHRTEVMDRVMARGAVLREELGAMVDADSAAFDCVSAAFALPKATDEDKRARSAAIQSALTGCIQSPLRVMTLAAEALALAAEVAPEFNLSAASDLGVSALSLKAAMQGAWLNVLINIDSLKDKDRAAAFRQEGQALLGRAIPAADSLYRQVLVLCGG